MIRASTASAPSGASVVHSMNVNVNPPRFQIPVTPMEKQQHQRQQEQQQQQQHSTQMNQHSSKSSTIPPSTVHGFNHRNQATTAVTPSFNHNNEDTTASDAASSSAAHSTAAAAAAGRGRINTNSNAILHGATPFNAYSKYNSYNPFSSFVSSSSNTNTPLQMMETTQTAPLPISFTSDSDMNTEYVSVSVSHLTRGGEEGSNVNAATIDSGDSRAAPYISVDGRRKRRRTTLDDAFRHLSIMEQQQQQHMFPYHATTATATATGNANSCPPSLSFVTPTANNNPNSNHNQNNHILTNLDDDISKKLNYDKTTKSSDMMDGMILHSNLDYNHETSFCSLTSSQADDDDDDAIEEGDVMIGLDDDGDDNNNELVQNGANVGKNVMENDVGSLPSIHSVLFAPKKNRNRQKNIIYDQSTNPVDDRIEELIRHSRIQAMIQLSKPIKSNKNGDNGDDDDDNNCQVRKNYEKMLVGNNEKIKSMDTYGCHSLRRKNSSNSLDEPNRKDGSCHGNGSDTNISMNISMNQNHQNNQKMTTSASQKSTFSSASPYSIAAIRRKGKSNDDHDILRGRRMSRAQEQSSGKGGNQRSRSIPRQMKYRCSSPTLNDVDMI